MFSIPVEKLPLGFKEESRRNVLYAPLRNKSVNPNDWNSKIYAWSQLVELYCSCNNVYCFSLESLKKAFQDNGRAPACLEEVLEDMASKGHIMRLDTYLQKRSETWSGWAVNTFISSPMSWSFNKMKSFYSSNDVNKLYVPVKVLQQDGDFLLDKISANQKTKVMTLKEFLVEEKINIEKANDFKILLKSLYNRGKVGIMELPKKEGSELENFLIKFNSDDLVVSEVDLSIHTLEQSEKMLERNIGVLEDDVCECIKEAKDQLFKNHRQLAKSSLRKKQEIEKRIEKKARALHNVQILLNKLQDSKMDENIWESYKKSMSAFETIFKKGISEDAVEDTMLKMGEMMEMHADIESSLARPVVDEDFELEEELDQLLKDYKDDNNTNTNTPSPQKQITKDLNKLDLNFPEIPSEDSSPVAAEEKITATIIPKM